MRGWRRLGPVGLTVAVLMAACAPQGPAASPGASATEGQGAGDEQGQAGPKRITAAIRGDPHTLYQKLNPRSNIPGIDALEELVNAGLTVPDLQGVQQPRLAEAVPTIENGLWKTFEDGRMETTWRIRQGVQWQDGAPLTADDLVFTAMVLRDKDLPIFGHIAYASVEGVEAPDSRTVTVKWKQPYIDAHTMFTWSLALPIPRHLLANAYAEDKEHLIDHPYWSVEFVGTGPYKVREWERGSHLVLEANSRYLLGRPRIDEIKVKFIADPNTLGANILAGEVDLTMGGRLSTEWAMAVRDQWRDGALEVRPRSMIQIFPQFIDPNPPVVSVLQFRRALMHAMDRQQMMETLQFGMTSVGHVFVSPSEPEYRHIEGSTIRYDYDPRKAAQMIEALGYSRGPDGIFRPDPGGRDPGSQRLAIQIRTSLGDDLQEKSMYAVADDWQRLGIDVERHLVPPQRARDAEYRATFPAFDLKRQAGTMAYAISFHSSRVALSENRYLVSGNNARYRSPELDSLIDRYFTTIPLGPRMELAAAIARHVTDQVAWMGLFYQTEPDLIANRLQNVTIPQASGSTMLWDVHRWDLR